MKRWMLCAAMILAAVQAGWPQEAPKKAEEAPKKAESAPPISALGWLVGGVWTADATKLGPGLQRIETRYQWSDNKAFLRFTTHFVFDKGTANTYDGQFFWNASGNTLAMWYMSAKGEIAEGPVEWDGTVLRIHFRGQNFEGKQGDLRVEVTRKSNDQYHWALFEKTGEEWKEMFGLEYLRQG